MTTDSSNKKSKKATLKNSQSSDIKSDFIKTPKAEIVINEDSFDPQKIKKPKKPLSKKAKIIIAVSSVLVILSGAGLAYALTRPKPAPPPPPAVVKPAPPKKTTVPSPLTGLEVTPEAAKRPPVAVVIENLYPDARPQSGLSSAGVVYEALAEGGITRYLAIFQDNLPTTQDIGPIRSLRTYHVDWTLEYKAPVVHVGGNIDALTLIKPTGLKSLNQFYNGNYFRRITNRYAPHNLYSTGKDLGKLLVDRGYDQAPSFTPWLRKDDEDKRTGAASNISVNFSSSAYTAGFSYDTKTKTYLRTIGGKADIDANTKAQIAPKNIVVLSMPTTNSAKAGDLTLVMKTVGSGQAWIFTDGGVTVGRWQKDSRDSRIKFYNETGAEAKLNRGQTWVSVIPTDKTVTYQ